MGWVYVLVRTFPFWAIPVGLGFLTAAVRTKKGSGKKKIIYFIIGIFLNAASAYFLMNKGHLTAVPFVHQLIHGQR